MTANGQVETANRSTSSIKGKVRIKLGQIEVEAKWVLSFNKNLINDSDILKKGESLIALASSAVIELDIFKSPSGDFNFKLRFVGWI